MTTIYLSSTYVDLRDYRQVVFDALRRSGYQVIAMEDYVAADRRPVEKCLEDVGRADIYIGLFGFRYGYCPPTGHNNPDGLSVTELEFRHARSLGKPCLVFVAGPDAPLSRKLDDAHTGQGDSGARIKGLRNHLLTECMASFFLSPHELVSMVQAAVAKKVEELGSAQPHPAREAQAFTPITWDIERKGSPFPGLMHFTRRFAPVFFGREAEVREVLHRICMPEGRFIIVSGDSGSGKSSLVDAGVLPAVEEAGLPGYPGCLCIRMAPSQGGHPFDALTRVLHAPAERAGLDAYRLGEELRGQPEIFSEKIRAIISKGSDADALVLFLDQMEELFTVRESPGASEETDAFINAIHGAVYDAPLRVIATIRSDFLHHCHRHSALLRVLRGGGHYPIGRAEPYMMYDMIVKPAECAGLKIPQKLVSRLIQETGSDPGNLPLLAFVLQRLFEQRQSDALSEAAYDAFGGAEGAIMHGRG